jgi:hypothetical protein
MSLLLRKAVLNANMVFTLVSVTPRQAGLARSQDSKALSSQTSAIQSIGPT